MINARLDVDADALTSLIQFRINNFNNLQEFTFSFIIYIFFVRNTNLYKKKKKKKKKKK